MKIYFTQIALAVLCISLPGCKSTGDKPDKSDKPEKQLTSIRLSLEADPTNVGHTKTISILRDHPTLMQIQDTSFLDERYVKSAAIVDWKDSFYVEVKFDWHGTIALDNITAANPGKRIAVEASFDEEQRWLAAPVIKRRIADGTFTFTPDATREETERIVRGLNNLTKKLEKYKKFDSPPAKFD